MNYALNKHVDEGQLGLYAPFESMPCYIYPESFVMQLCLNDLNLFCNIYEWTLNSY